MEKTAAQHSTNTTRRRRFSLSKNTDTVPAEDLQFADAAAHTRRKPLATGEDRLAHLRKALPETAYQAAERALDATDAMRQKTREIRAALFPEAEEALEHLRQCAKDLRKLTAAAIREENRRRAAAGR